MGKNLYLRFLINLYIACLAMLTAGCGKESFQPSVSAQPSNTVATDTPSEIPNTPVVFPTLPAVIPLVPNQTEVAYIPPFAYIAAIPAVDIVSNEADPGHREEIAQRLVIKWLVYYTGEDLPNRVRLQEYTIISVTVPDELQFCVSDTEKEFRAKIHFRVKLLEIYYNPWHAGGGEASDDLLWVTRSHTPLIVQEGDNYVMVFDGVHYCNTPVP